MWDHNKRFFSFNIRKNARTGASASGILPPKIVQESRVPQFYRDTIAQCGAETITKLPNTNEVICLLWRSGLPEAVLSAIWNSVGISPNGQLTRQEFYSILVLIALAQKNMTIADLSTLPSLPIPHLSAVKPKSMTIKQFEKNSVLSQPNGHLLKTVHPLFTESNVKLNGDLISFDSFDNADSSADLEELYSLSDSKSPSAQSVPKDNFVHIWEKIIDVAFEVFADVKQTNSKMLDAFYTKKGHQYLLSLISIQQIVKRICRSCHHCSSVNLNLVSRCEIMMAVWSSLIELIDTNRLPLEEPIEMEQTDYLCNICGTNLSVNNTHFDKDTELSYHINCANFWLNKVDTQLPRVN